MLGDIPTNYQTSSQAQSANIPEKGRYDNRLSPEVKRRLQNSQFTLGDSKNDFSTDYNLEYYDKSSLNNRSNSNDLLEIRKKLRSDNYIKGQDETNYISENAGKYTKPILNYEEYKKNKMQTNEYTKFLRAGTVDLGSDNVQWNTSNRLQYTPKKLLNNRYVNNANQLSDKNFPKLKEDRDFKSEAMYSYNKKPLTNNKISNEFRENLRKNHFDFGDNKYTDINTVNREDYKDPRLDKNYNYNSFVLDKNKYRNSQWSLNGGQNENYFNTTYLRTMTPKKIIKQEIGNLAALQNNIQIGDGKSNPDDYNSVYNENYGNKNLNNDYYLNYKDKEMADNIKNYNKNSHIELFEGKGDFNTTMGQSFKYNANDAKNAYNVLDPKFKMNIRGTHYQLGDNSEMEKETSNRRDYIAYPNNMVERVVSANRRNMENMNFGNSNENFDAATIYMTDYTKKPLMYDDEEVDLYLKNRYKNDKEY